MARSSRRRLWLFPRRFRPTSLAPLFFLHRSRVRARRLFLAVIVVVAAAATTLLPLALFTGLNSGNGDLWVRLFPRRFFLQPCACQLRYRAFVAAVAVAAFLRRALSLGLNPKDGSRALATAGSSLTCAATIVAVVAAVAVHPQWYFWNSIPGIHGCSFCCVEIGE